MTADRRTFLKMAAAAAVSAAGGALCLESTASRAGAASGGGVKWAKAPCRFCGTGCGVQVGVENGRVVALAGDPSAEVNNGLLCVKGYHAGLALYGKDRLTTPLLRRGSSLAPIPWETAIRIIADRVAMNPAGFAMYGSGQWTIAEAYAAQKFMRGGLSNNHLEANARLCMASAVTGFLATYGVDEPAGCFDDLDAADVVITWGNNPAETHPVLFSRIIDRRNRGENVTLIDMGTRRTRTTAYAQYSLLFRPSSDLAIANAILRLLVRQEGWDKDFVAKHCSFRAPSDPPTLYGKPVSFDEWKALLEPYTLEAVERRSGVSIKDLRMLAELFARKDVKVTSLWCMGMNQHTRGTAINCLVHGIHLFSGHFGRPGDSPTSLTGQPSACGSVREVGASAEGLPGGRLIEDAKHRSECEALWNLPAGRIRAEPGYDAVKLWEQFGSDEDGNIHTIWVQVTNPSQTLPNRNKLFDPSRGDPSKFLIVSDVYPTATTAEADLILPSAMWVEKNGMYGNSERRTQHWFKMVNPPGQARDDCWQTIAVAWELYRRGFAGMKDKNGKFLFDLAAGAALWDWGHYYDVNVDKLLFEEYRKFSPFKHKNLAPYDEYVKKRGLRWPVVEQADGSWRETRFRFVEGEDPNVSKGKGFDFYHSTTDDGRAQIWVHPYEPPPQAPDDEYPFWLCTGRVLEHWHTGTLTGRIPQLSGAMPQGYLEMNREDAHRLEIRDGELVLLQSRLGEVKIPVWIEGRGTPPPGTVFVPFFDERFLVNQVTNDTFDPFSKQPDFKKCAVRIRRLVE